jgi:hypothetical protein
MATGIKSWAAPKFQALAPAMDSFLLGGLNTSSQLVREQTLDFLSVWSQQYASALRNQAACDSLATAISAAVSKVDDADLQIEWALASQPFEEPVAWFEPDLRTSTSAFSVLHYYIPSEIVNSSPRASDTFTAVASLVTASMARAAVNESSGIAVAVNIELPKESASAWLQASHVVARLERFMQETAEQAWTKIQTLPTFVPAQAARGSWSLILHSNMSKTKAEKLASTLQNNASQTKEGTNPLERWSELAAEMEEMGLRVHWSVDYPSIGTALPFVFNTDQASRKAPETKVRVLSRDVPQADSLKRLMYLVKLVHRYPNSSADARSAFIEKDGITPRQYAYYQRALGILGLVDVNGRPTNATAIAVRLSKEAVPNFLKHRFTVSDVGSSWIIWSDCASVDDLSPHSATRFLTESAPSLSPITAERRASTLRLWLEQFANRLT